MVNLFLFHLGLIFCIYGATKVIDTYEEDEKVSKRVICYAIGMLLSGIATIIFYYCYCFKVAVT